MADPFAGLTALEPKKDPLEGITPLENTDPFSGLTPLAPQGILSNAANSFAQGGLFPQDMYSHFVEGKPTAQIQAEQEAAYPTTPGITSDLFRMGGQVATTIGGMAAAAYAGAPAAVVYGAGGLLGLGQGVYQANQRGEELTAKGMAPTAGQQLGMQIAEGTINAGANMLTGGAAGVALGRGKTVFDTVKNLGKMAAAKEGLGTAFAKGAAQEAAINMGSIAASDTAAKVITGAPAEDIYGTPSQFGYKLGIAGLGSTVPGGLFRRSAQKRVNKQADWAQEIIDTMEFGLDKYGNEYMRPKPTEKTVGDYAESVEERAARMAQTPATPRVDIHNMLPEEYAALPPEQKTDSGRPIYAYLTPAEQKVMDARPNSRRSQVLAQKASFRKDWAEHKAAVESALAAGKTVPDEVLAEYPSLRKAQEKKVKEAAKAQKTLDDLKQAELDREAKLAQDVKDAWEREELRKVAELGEPGLSAKYFGKYKKELFPIYTKSRAERKAAEKDAAAKAKLDAKNAEIEKKALDAQAKVAADGIAAAKAKAERDALIPRMAESISSGEIILDAEFGPHKDLLQKYKKMMKDRADEISKQIKKDKDAELQAAIAANKRESEAAAKESARENKTIGEWFRSKIRRKGALDISDKSEFWDHVQRSLPAHLRNVGWRTGAKDVYSASTVREQMPILGGNPFALANTKSKSGKPRVSMNDLWVDFKHEYPELFQEIDPADPAGAKIESENMKKFFDLVLKNSPEPLLKDRTVGLEDEDALAQEAAWQKREAADRRREAEAAGYNVTGNPEEFQIPVKHGTAKEFNEFNNRYMGTGEGMQAFGWGMYFTSKEEIARNYAESIASVAENRTPVLTYKGKYYQPNTPATPELLEAVRRALIKRYRNSVPEIIEAYKAAYDDVQAQLDSGLLTPTQESIARGGQAKRAEAIEALEIKLDSVIQKKYAALKNKTTLDDMEGFLYADDLFGEPLDYAKQELATEGVTYTSQSVLDNIAPRVFDVTLHKGKEPSQYVYMDWYKPLEGRKLAQVQNAIDILLNEVGSQDTYYKNAVERVRKAIRTQDDEFGVIYRLLAQDFGDKQVSMALLRSGVDGIEYAADTLRFGKPKRGEQRGTNYVVFDPQTAKIDKISNLSTGEVSEFQAARNKKESPLPDIKGATNKSPFDTRDTQMADELDAGNIPDMVGPDLVAEKADLEYSTRKGQKAPLPEYDSPEQIVEAHSQAVQGIALELVRKGVFSAVIINKGQLYHPTERYWDAEQGREMAPKVNAHLMFNAPGEAPALMLSPNVDLNTVWHEVGHAAYEIVGADDPLMLDLAKVFNGDLEQSFNAFGDIVSGKFFQANGPMDLAHRTMLIMRKLIGKAIKLPGGMDRLQLDAVMRLQNAVTRSDYELFKNRTTKSLVDDLNRYNAPRMSQKVQASRMAGMLTTDPDAFVKKTARDLYGAPSEYHADRARTILADPILVDKLLAKAQDRDAGISPAESLALVALNNQVARVIAYAKKYGTEDNIKATQISLREYVLALSAAGTKWGQSGKFMQMPLTLETTKMMIEHQLGRDLTPAQMKLLEDVARSPEELAKMIGKIQDPTAKDFIGNWVRSSLLLGGAIPNSIWYNTLMLGFKVAQYPTRAGLDTLLSVTGLRGLVAGEKTRQYLWRDVAEYYKGLAKGFMTVPAKQKALIESTELGHYVNQNLWADWAYNLKKEAETLTGGKYVSNRMKAVLAKIGHIQGYSIKLMELMDRQFRNAAFEAEVQTRASRWARSQPGAQIGNAVFEKARKLYLDSLENDPDLLALIHNSANSIAFMDEGGPILNGLKSLRNAVDEVSPIIPLGTAIVPFMHTAGRAMNFTFDIMPGVGLAKGLTRKMNQRAKIRQWEYRQGKDADAAEATGKSTPEEIEAIRNKPWNKEKVDMLEVLANQVLGTGLAAALLAWADGKDDQGRPLVVGKTPIAPGLKAVFQTGMEYRPYSVQIPQGINPTGQPQYLEMSRFGSFAPLLQTLTALKDTLLNPKEPYESGAKMLQDFLQEFSKLTLDSSFLEQPSKLLSGTAPLDRLADSVKGFVPFSEAGRLLGRAATLYLQGEGQTQMSRLIGAGSLQRSALGDVKGGTLAEEGMLVGLRMASRMVGPDVITHVAVPTAKQLGMLTDPELANKIQAEKVGVWGGSWKLRTSVLSDLIAPFRTWTPKDDPTTKELYRLGRGINPPGETIKIDPRTGRISPKGMEMTMPFEMYDFVARGVGQKRKEVMDRLMSTTSWNSLSDSRKLALINHRMQSLEPLRLRLARTYLRDNPALQELLAVQGKQAAGSQESLR